MGSEEYNNTASHNNNQQSQSNMIFHDMNLTRHLLGSSPSIPFTQDLISSRPFNNRQDFTPSNPHLNLKLRFPWYQKQNQGWETQI